MEKEKEEGILLVFGPHSMQGLELNDKYIRCRLQFQRWEEVQIPMESISRIFDKGSQVTMDWFYLPAFYNKKGPGTSLYDDEFAHKEDSFTVPFIKKKKSTAARKTKKKKVKSSGQVIQVDFRRD